MKIKGLSDKDLDKEFVFLGNLIDPKNKDGDVTIMRHFVARIEGRVMPMRWAIQALHLYFAHKVVVEFVSGRGVIKVVLGKKRARKTFEVMRFCSVDRQEKDDGSDLEEKEIVGWLDDFFETGCEGVMWSVEEDGKNGYEALHILQEGDWLTVRDRGGKVIFDGAIHEDRTAGYKPYPNNPTLGQPCALGFWVHWTQRGWHPDDWALLFFREPGSKLWAVLRKAKKLE